VFSRLTNSQNGPAFTKPVATLAGEAIEAWESQRLEQHLFIDCRTALIDNLFINLLIKIKLFLIV